MGRVWLTYRALCSLKTGVAYHSSSLSFLVEATLRCGVDCLALDNLLSGPRPVCPHSWEPPSLPAQSWASTTLRGAQVLPAPSLRSFLLLAQRFLVTAQLRCHPLLPSPSEEFLSLRHQLTFAASLFCLVSVTDTVRKQPSELTALPTRRGIARAVRQLAAALRLTCTLNMMAPPSPESSAELGCPCQSSDGP